MKRYTIGLITLILTSSFAYGQDWPELGRYSENNKKYAQSSDNKDRVIFMGNSITEGWSTILPAKGFPWNPGINPPPKISAVNKIIEQYAKENGMIYLDYSSSMVDKNNALIESYGSDSVHPNKKGYKVMSVLAEKAIFKILNQN